MVEYHSCVCVCVCVCVCLCVYHLYLYIDEHLGCFHTLSTISNTAMNTGVYTFSQISFLFSVLMDKYPEIEFLVHTAVLFLIFEETSYCFP